MEIVEQNRLSLLRDPGGEAPPAVEVDVADEIDPAADGDHFLQRQRLAVQQKERRVLEGDRRPDVQQALPERLDRIDPRLDDPAQLTQHVGVRNRAVDRGGTRLRKHLHQLAVDRYRAREYVRRALLRGLWADAPGAGSVRRNRG